MVAGVGLFEPVADGLGVGFTLGATVGLADGLGVGFTEGFGVGVGFGVTEGEGVGVGVGVTEGEGEGVGVGDADGEGVGEGVGVGVTTAGANPPPEDGGGDDGVRYETCSGVTGAEALDGDDGATEVTAVTVNVYGVPLVRPNAVIGDEVPVKVSPVSSTVTMYS